MKNWKQFTFVAVIAIVGIIIGFMACDNGGNNNPKTYTVTIGTLTNGSITANPTSGTEGTEITLTIYPENLYRLKAGSLKHGSTDIDETTLKFNLPANDVIITAQFESLFIGTWEFDDVQLIFVENNFTIKLSGKNYFKGTFTVSETEFQLTRTHMWTDEQWVEGLQSILLQYNLQDNNTLVIGSVNGSTADGAVGIYIRQ